MVRGSITKEGVLMMISKLLKSRCELLKTGGILVCFNVHRKVENRLIEEMKHNGFSVQHREAYKDNQQAAFNFQKDTGNNGAFGVVKFDFGISENWEPIPSL